MDNEKEYKRSIGDYLKNIRTSKNVTTRQLGGITSYSQGHISGIENGTKTTPNLKFIKSYLNALSESSIEYNKYVDDINQLANGKLVLSKIDNDGKNQKQVNVLNYLTANGEEKSEYLNVPVNDLSFHLNDLYNEKFFGGYRMTDQEKKHILEYVYTYLKSSKENTLNLLKPLDQNLSKQIGEVPEESNTKLYASLYRSLVSIKGDIKVNMINLEEIERAYHVTKKKE